MDRMDAAARAMSGHAAPDAVHQAGACAACSYEDYLRGTLSIKIEGMPPFEQIAPGALRTYENDGLAFDDLRLGDGLHLDAVVSNRSEEHTSELQSLMRIPYAVFCLNKKQDSNPSDANTNIA